MSKPRSPKPTKDPKLHPGEQVVYRVLAETKALVKRTAHEANCSMNASAGERLATCKWPRAEKEVK